MSEPMRNATPEQDTEESTTNDESPSASSTDTGTTTTETRWELGVFARKVTTQSSSPPDYPKEPP